jgi:hypothetical protein
MTIQKLQWIVILRRISMAGEKSRRDFHLLVRRPLSQKKDPVEDGVLESNAEGGVSIGYSEVSPNA